MKKLEIALSLALDAVALLYEYWLDLALVTITALLAVIGLIAAFKGSSWSVWIFPLLFGACAFALTYRLLAQLGLVKRRSGKSALQRSTHGSHWPGS